jgi:NhaA family Na+:H+ antiporter
VGGWSGLSDAIGDRVAIGIIVGLILGKAIGIFATTYALASFTDASLDDDLTWGDIAGVAVLGGVGFTVSVLLSELAFGHGSPRDDHAKVAILLGSLLAAVFAAAILHRRNRRHSGQAA